MSAAYWRSQSVAAIAEALASVPADADDKAKLKAISAAYPFGERRMYPYKIWLDCVAQHFGKVKKASERKAAIKIAAYEQATGKKFPRRDA